MAPVIPPKGSRKEPQSYDAALYQARYLVENCFGKMKEWRGVAWRPVPPGKPTARQPGHHAGLPLRKFYNSSLVGIDPLLPDPDMYGHTDVGATGTFVLQPGEFAIASTTEHVRLPDNIAARPEGKSSLGRIGLMVHSTAGFIDSGWEGQLTLELSNLAKLPINLTPGMKIGQLSFIRHPTLISLRPVLRLTHPGQPLPEPRRRDTQPHRTDADRHGWQLIYC